ncbi:hypothetical protein Tco_0194801 [Tanacetum coccineum]
MFRHCPSASSSLEYSWSESRIKISDHNSSRLRSLEVSSDGSKFAFRFFVRCRTPCHALPKTRDKKSVGFVLKKGTDTLVLHTRVLKRQHFYGFAANTSSSKDVYSKKRIIAVTRLTIMKMYDYGHLEEIEVRREDQKLYKFREGDFPRL